jgi:hypothetical protein
MHRGTVILAQGGLFEGSGRDPSSTSARIAMARIERLADPARAPLWPAG